MTYCSTDNIYCYFLSSAITPANLYYSETISTLRYAQRAKSIINKPKINEVKKPDHLTLKPVLCYNYPVHL